MATTEGPSDTELAAVEHRLARQVVCADLHDQLDLSLGEPVEVVLAHVAARTGVDVVLVEAVLGQYEQAGPLLLTRVGGCGPRVRWRVSR